MDGVQDLTGAVKWNALDTALTSVGNLQAFLVASGSVPLSDYTPDFLPMSIGLHSKRASGRLTLNFQAKQGWFVRGHGRLHLARRGDARPACVLRRRAARPERPGGDARRDRLHLPRRLLEARPVPARSPSRSRSRSAALDIRRQDVPFVSNRMNASRLDALAMYYLPKPRHLVVRLGATHDAQRAQRREVDDVHRRPPLHLQVLGRRPTMKPTVALLARRRRLATAFASPAAARTSRPEDLAPSAPPAPTRTPAPGG